MLKVIVEGRINEPKEVTFDSGKKVLNFSVAHEYKKKDGDKTVLCTQWVNVSMWDFQNTVFVNGQSVSPELLVKGKLVHIEGYPMIEGYADQATGEIKTGLKVVVKHIDLLAA